MDSRRGKRSVSALEELNVEQFMALPTSDEDEATNHKVKTSRKRKRVSGKQKAQTRKMYTSESSTSELSDFLVEEDFDWTDEVEGGSESENGDMGVVEPRPPHITSWKEKVEGSEDEAGDDGEGTEEELSKEGRQEGSGGGRMEETPTGDDEEFGKKVTMLMLTQWVEKIEKSHSLHSMRQLCASLRAAITTFLHRQQDTPTQHGLLVKDSVVFNGIVASCFQHVPLCLHHHFPLSATPSSTAPCPLPSTQDAWRKVRRTVKLYLTDLLFLAETLQDLDMQKAVLKQFHSMAAYFVCLPKLLKLLNKCLVEKWSTGENSVQVLAFLAMRRTVLLQPHPALHTLLKKAYMAFVRNCKFCSTVTVGGILFMVNSLVELLALDPPTAYQHGFIYIRQLAVHLRAALTSTKKDAQQTVYNWQFVHCLGLWTQMLVQISHPSLRPLTYPLVQTILGTLQVQPSAKYHPLRIHLLRMLLQLSTSTDTLIPMATYILEMLEAHGMESSGGQKSSGKPPELSMLLKATKQQLSTQSFKAALLNEAFLLMLKYFSAHAHYISFPELSYPALVRLRKVSKETRYSWLRTQLKVLIEKVEEVSQQTTTSRGKVTFSPVNFDLVAAWEKERKGVENQLSKFLSSWIKVHRPLDPAHTASETSQGTPKAGHVTGGSGQVKDTLARDSDSEGSEEDFIEDLQLDSDTDSS